MRHLELLQLLENNVVIPLDDISAALHVSGRSVRTIISDLKKSGEQSGFTIHTVPRKGYKLHITDDEKYQKFISEQQRLHTKIAIKPHHKSKRIIEELYFLFQQNDYISLQTMADLMQVSRNTILRDISEIRELLLNEQLELVSKAHFGIKVKGDELHYRRAFSKYVLESDKYLATTKHIMNFIEEIDTVEIEKYVYDIFVEYKLIAPKSVVSAILDHLYILIYRVKQQNYISKLEINMERIEPHYVEIANKIILWIEQQEYIVIPDLERLYLASQLAGKTSVEAVPQIEKAELLRKITYTLKALDLEFFTDFAADSVLKESLLLHMYPLLQRMAVKMQLENPLIDDVSQRYANVFLVALRFSELWNNDDHFKLSRDEIGYLALHFATHFEAKRYDVVRDIQRIAIISEVGGGGLYLLKAKVEQTFPNAVVANVILNNIDNLIDEDLDLILITCEEEDVTVLQADTLIIKVKPLLDDAEIKRIKKEVISNRYLKDLRTNNSKGLLSLFSKDLFSLQKNTDQSYLEIITEMAQEMVKQQVALTDFPQSVLEREEKTDTIYRNGVAGPHSMSLHAIRNCISVRILAEPISYLNKEVQLIFLINIKDGNLFLYREISEFLLKLMDDPALLGTIRQVRTFQILGMFSLV